MTLLFSDLMKNNLMKLSENVVQNVNFYDINNKHRELIKISEVDIVLNKYQNFLSIIFVLLNQIFFSFIIFFYYFPNFLLL